MVTFNENTSKLLIDLQAATLVDALAKAETKNATDCLREFMTTKTFELLADPESYLCLESPAYVMDMLDAERAGDWERWLEGSHGKYQSRFVPASAYRQPLYATHNLTIEQFRKLDHERDILTFLEIGYEPYHLTGDKGVLDEIDEIVAEQLFAKYSELSVNADALTDENSRYAARACLKTRLQRKIGAFSLEILYFKEFSNTS
ncbi:MAG: hypothetical protein LBS62_07440 [Clostridiales bacterium]|jgi:hypothetical protein|nr:hypothetical protein [Clostridiales bacterium]